MANKNRTLSSSGRGSTKPKPEGEIPMGEQDQEQQRLEEEQQEGILKEEVTQDEELKSSEPQEDVQTVHEQQELLINEEASAQPPNVEDEMDKVLSIDGIVKPGKFGVTNSQMIPAIKKAIAEASVEKLKLLRGYYLYSFENSLKYLNKSEREFIETNLK